MSTVEATPGQASPPPGPAIWFSAAEAAEVLGITVGSLRRRCRQGLVPHEIHDGETWIQWVHLPVPTATGEHAAS